jgi:hypothetical protein
VLNALVLATATAIALPVPYVPQEKDTCGAAALAMVMGYWGRDVPHGEIAAALVEEELQGIRGSRLADFARARGMSAIAFAGEWDVVREHLAKGRPVVLAIDAGRGRLHDVVALGIDDGRAEVIVHDPARGPERRIGKKDLEKRWAKSGRWALLVTPRDTDVPSPEGPAGSEMADPSGPDAAGAPRGDRPNATTWPPKALSYLLPPPAAITTSCRPVFRPRKVIGVAKPLAGSSADQSSRPVSRSNARMRRSLVAATNTSPPSVTIEPPMLGAPVFGTPRRVSSSISPSRTCQRNSPESRSIAVRVPQGGFWQG